MKIYLHIGIENTGTTSIQTFFRNNRHALMDDGIYYPNIDEINHMSLAIFSVEELSMVEDLLIGKEIFGTSDKLRLRNEIESSLLGELSGLPDHITSLVLSNEHCSSRLFQRSEINRLKGLLEKITEEIKIIIYIRRQDELLLSQYNTYVKYGGKQWFNDYAADSYDISCPNYYNYMVLLDNWASVFEEKNIIVRVFDKNQLQTKSIVNDFLDTCDITKNYKYSYPDKQNLSLDKKTLLFLRKFNEYIPMILHNKINPERGNIVDLLDCISQVENEHYCPNFILDFYSLFAESNQTVAKKYLKRDYLFDESTQFNITTAHEHEGELTFDEAFEIFTKIWLKTNNS